MNGSLYHVAFLISLGTTWRDIQGPNLYVIPVSKTMPHYQEDMTVVRAGTKVNVAQVVDLYKTIN